MTEKKNQRTHMSGLAALKANLNIKQEEEQPEEKTLGSLIKEKEPGSLIKEPETLKKSEVVEVNKDSETNSSTNHEEIPISLPKVKTTVDLSKKPLSSFLQKRNNVRVKKETVNICTKNRDALKSLAINASLIQGSDGEKVGVSDIVENVIEWFIESYYEEIIKKPGMKEILKHLGIKQ